MFFMRKTMIGLFLTVLLFLPLFASGETEDPFSGSAGLPAQLFRYG